MEPTLSDVAAYVAQSVDRPARTPACWPAPCRRPAPASRQWRRRASCEIAASPTGQLAYVTNKAVGHRGSGHDHDAEHVGRLAQHRHRTGLWRRDRNGLAVLGASSFTTKGTASVTVSLKPGHLHLLLPGPRPPRGGDVRHADRQVAGPGAAPRSAGRARRIRMTRADDHGDRRRSRRAGSGRPRPRSAAGSARPAPTDAGAGACAGR